MPYSESDGILHFKNNPKTSLINLLMNLRLVCDHPILFESKRFYDCPEHERFREQFINKSNKLKLIERILDRLLPKQHKVLLFS